MDISISEMKAEEYAEVAALWQTTEGIGLDNDVDSREGIASYLSRNPGFSHVARHDHRIIAAVLCGHDGRRGYLHHLAVSVEWRKKGVGQALVEASLKKLASACIPKCNIFLFADNELGESFWQHTGWSGRTDLKVLQRRCSIQGIQ